MKKSKLFQKFESRNKYFIMKKLQIYFFIFFFFLAISNINAQNEIQKKIKKIYYSTNEKIASYLNDSTEYSEIYCNELIINTLGEKYAQWPACGNYIKKIVFWYKLAPPHWDGNGKSALIKINYSEKYALNSEVYEFLFDEGKLVFCFLKHNDSMQYRYYFDKEKLIEFTEKIDENDEYYTKPESSEILDKSKKLQNLFLTMFDN